MEAPLSATAQVRLRDGRVLGYSTTGPPRGRPVIYMHGAIGSPVRRSPELERAIESLGLRYVVVDRPGFGASDPDPGRTVASFAADIEQLADALELDRFAVLGVSAGAPYALACAWHMPERVAAAASVSSVPPGLPPHRAAGMSLACRVPLIGLAAAPALTTRLGDAVLRTLRRHPGLLARALVTGAPRADRALLDDPAARETAVRSFFAAARQGVAPMVEDYVACCRPWGFEPAEVGGLVQLWHGERDRLVPVRHVRRLAERLPRRALRVLPGQGHFFMRAHLDDIVAPLVDALGGDDASGRWMDLAA